MSFLSGYTKRKAIKYGTVFPSSNLTDFPLYVKIVADADIAAELASGGGIAITTADEVTQIPLGLYPSSVLSTGNIKLRLLAGSILTGATTGDVIGYIYFNSGATTVEDKAGVVSNGYALFMPLEENPSGSAPQMFDWVTETNIGTSNGTMTSGDLVTGVVGNGLDFDGSDDYIALPADADLDGQNFTIEIWFYSINTTARGLFERTTNGVLNSGSLMFLFGSLTFRINRTGGQDDAGASPVFTNTWHYGAGTFDGTTVRCYLDANAPGVGSGSGAAVTGTGIARIGALIDVWNFQGVIDEIRYSSVTRTTNWLSYARVNDLTPELTTTLGDLETDGGATVYQDIYESSIFEPILF